MRASSSNSRKTMNSFILNRPDDFLRMSKGRIVGTVFKWLVLLMVCSVLLRIMCIAIYMSQGINPMELTRFGGDPTGYIGRGGWKTYVRLLCIAPLMEELMFRFALSFKRAGVAIWAGLLPVICALYLHHCKTWYILLGMLAAGAVLAGLIIRFTTVQQWKEWRSRYIVPAMWTAAVGFGLLHLRAFTVLNWQLLPFALTTILVPFAGGCAITYARVNLGFIWGVLLHCLINLPGVLIIMFS